MSYINTIYAAIAARGSMRVRVGNVLFFSIVLINITACRKDRGGENDVPVNTAEKIKSTLSNGFLQEYEYDNKGRLTQIKMQGVVRSTFSYQPGKATQVHYSDLGVVTNTNVYTLNNDGLALKEEYPSNPTAITTYAFNDARQMIKDKRVIGADTYEYTYYYNSSGNADSMHLFLNGAWFIGQVFEYYTDKTASAGYPNYGYTHFGKGNKNPVRKEVERYSNGNTNENISTYEYDAQGRIISSMRVTDLTDTTRVAYTYY
jgi:YD repeat-containing protein